MLPSHLLLDSTKKRNEPLSHTRLGQQQPSPPMMMGRGGGGTPPSLCVTGAMCQQGRWNDPKRPNITLFYCIFRPRQLHDHLKPPLVVLHGGPSIPSNYLLPIVNGVTDRSIVFYDQWGCGKSSRPQQLLPSKSSKSSKSSKDNNNSDSKTTTNNDNNHNTNNIFPMDIMIDHLHQLLTVEWKLQHYHLFGHSFGGILAYKYLQQHYHHHHPGDDNKNNNNNCCRSIILASTPTSASLIDTECKRLYKQINNLDINNNDIDNIDIDDKLQKEQYDETFRQTHECRLSQIPLVLMDALAQAGPTQWRGIQAIQNYDACTTSKKNATNDNENNNNNGMTTPPTTMTMIENLPCLLLCGEYDFCTTDCIDGWKNLFTNPKPITTTLQNCSHYGMLEDENQYGKSITEFLHQQEEEE